MEARTPTLKPQPQSPKLGGCVGVLFNFFDWNKRLHGSRLFSKRLPAGELSRDFPNPLLLLRHSFFFMDSRVWSTAISKLTSTRIHQVLRHVCERPCPLPASIHPWLACLLAALERLQASNVSRPFSRDDLDPPCALAFNTCILARVCMHRREGPVAMCLLASKHACMPASDAPPNLTCSLTDRAVACLSTVQRGPTGGSV